jgi:hypothetical protein
MNPVPVHHGQNGRVDGPKLHDHDRAAESDEERTKPPLHQANATGKPGAQSAGIAPVFWIAGASSPIWVVCAKPDRPYLAANMWNILFLAVVVEAAWYGIKLVRLIFKYNLDR